MRKLRYIAPGVVATAALVGGQAAPALAYNKKTVGCTKAQFCLYYSGGENSAIWKTSASKIPNLENYDFTNGLIVRNDAHSFNTSVFSYLLFSHVNYNSVRGNAEILFSNEPPGVTYGAITLLPGPRSCAGCDGERNNESSFEIY